MNERKSMKLIQYWNTEAAPTEVESLMETWRADPNFEYVRFTSESAKSFIEQQFTSRELEAFTKCKVPAMQADYLRYCALLVFGGIYVDADTENGGNLPKLIESSKRGLLMDRRGNLANDFIFVRNKNDPLVKEAIKRATANIEQEVSNNVWLVTGPGIMTGMRANPNERYFFDEFDILPVQIIRQTVIFRQALDYKNSDADWRNFRGTDGSSIFAR